MECKVINNYLELFVDAYDENIKKCVDNMFVRTYLLSGLSPQANYTD
jgi:hypothetical protein